MRALTRGSSDATSENVRIGMSGAKGADGVVTQVGGGGGGGGGGGAAKCSTLEEVIAMRRSGGGKVVIEQDNLVSTPHTQRLYKKHTHAQHTHTGRNIVLERAGGGGDGGGGRGKLDLKTSLLVHRWDTSPHLPRDMSSHLPQDMFQPSPFQATILKRQHLLTLSTSISNVLGSVDATYIQCTGLYLQSMY